MLAQQGDVRYTKRATFVVDKRGVIAKVFPEVKIKGHAAEVLEVVKTLE